MNKYHYIAEQSFVKNKIKGARRVITSFFRTSSPISTSVTKSKNYSPALYSIIDLRWAAGLTAPQAPQVLV